MMKGVMGNTVKNYGYIYASSMPSLNDQRKILTKMGISKINIREEMNTSKTPIEKRLVLKELAESELVSGDSLTITSIYNCGRNSQEYLKFSFYLSQKGVLLKTVGSGEGTTTITMASSFAEFDRIDRKNKQKQGIQSAKDAGKYKGRKSVINPKLILEVQDFKENQRLSVSEIARQTGLSRGTIYKVLKNELNYVPNKLIKK